MANRQEQVVKQCVIAVEKATKAVDRSYLFTPTEPVPTTGKRPRKDENKRIVSRRP